MSKLTLSLGIGAVALAFTTIAAAEDHLVPDQHATIQAAIDAAVGGDTVVVADGLYTGPGNRDLSFGGKAITVRSVNGPEQTIIDAQGTPEVPHRGFMFTNGEPASAVLDGFTITGGATLPGAIADEFNGGAILCNNGSSPTIRNCILENNSCGCWGAGICCTSASPTIINCQIRSNAADDDGGGLFSWAGSDPTIVNTLIVGNSAPVCGGGVAMFDGIGTLINSTVVGNEASCAAGVYAWNGTIVNSIIWGNAGDDLIASDTQAVVLYSNIQGGFLGIGNLNVDPMFVDPENGDYHLSSISPMLEAGANTLASELAETDFDGDLRIVGSLVDIGADEHRFAGDLNSDGLVNVSDLLQLIGNWGTCPGPCLADLNGDGAVNVSDLVQLLTDWT